MSFMTRGSAFYLDPNLIQLRDKNQTDYSLVGLDIDKVTNSDIYVASASKKHIDISNDKIIGKVVTFGNDYDIRTINQIINLYKSNNFECMLKVDPKTSNFVFNKSNPTAIFNKLFPKGLNTSNLKDINLPELKHVIITKYSSGIEMETAKDNDLGNRMPVIKHYKEGESEANYKYDYIRSFTTLNNALNITNLFYSGPYNVFESYNYLEKFTDEEVYKAFGTNKVGFNSLNNFIYKNKDVFDTRINYNIFKKDLTQNDIDNSPYNNVKSDVLNFGDVPYFYPYLLFGKDYDPNIHKHYYIYLVLYFRETMQTSPDDSYTIDDLKQNEIKQFDLLIDLADISGLKITPKEEVEKQLLAALEKAGKKDTGNNPAIGA